MVSHEDAPTLLSEQVGAFLGFKRIAQTVGSPNASPYLAPLAAWILGGVILSSISYLLIGRSQFETPFVLILPISIVVGIKMTKWVRSYYVTAVTNLPGNELSDEDLLPMPASRIPEGLFIFVYIGHLLTLYFSSDEVLYFINVHGEFIAYTKYIFITPFYFIVIADIAAILISSMIFLPWYIYKYDIRLDFSDITGFAGLYEVSRLLQVGTITYFVGLIFWTAFLITPSIVGGVTGISRTEEITFIILWVLGLLMYIAPFFLLHRHMSREKNREMNQIDQDIRSLDPDNNDRGIPYIDPEPRDIPKLQQKYIELQQIRESREYPINMPLLEDLAIAALSPIVFEWAFPHLIT